MTRDRDVEAQAPNARAILTRRSILQRAGWVIAAAPFARGAGIAEQPVSQVMDKLSSYMSEARSGALPDGVVEKVKHHSLDTSAAMVSGSKLAPGPAALRFAHDYGSEKVA